MTNDRRLKASSSDRRQFLVHINVEIIRRVKILAIEREVTASSLVQDAIAEFLARSDAARARD